jgi:hypothetical protein
MKQIKIFEMIAKSAGVDGSAGRIYVPETWIGKKVIVYLKEAVKTHGVKGAMTMEVIGLGITAIALGMGVALGARFILGVGLYTVGLWK